MLQNDQTYFKSLAVFTLQDFQKMFRHFLSLCKIGLMIVFDQIFRTWNSIAMNSYENILCWKHTLLKYTGWSISCPGDYLTYAVTAELTMTIKLNDGTEKVGQI